MHNPDISILVVDDARFSSAMIDRALKAAGYKDIRHASSASAGLRAIEERAASILVADWLMPEIDGLELTARVRQLDEANNHFTYVILLTAKEGVEALETAFDQGVDDFINKSQMSEELLPRIYAGERVCSQINRLLQENQQLMEMNGRLRKQTTHDPLTGLGNASYAQRRLDETLRHMASRGGAAAVLLVSITSFEQLRKQYPQAVISQLLLAVSRRLRQLVRPLDVVCRVAPHQFVMLSHQPQSENCTASNFRRIQDGILLKAYKTSAGYISIKAAASLAVCDEQHEPPGPEVLLHMAQQGIAVAMQTGLINVVRWDVRRHPRVLTAAAPQ